MVQIYQPVSIKERVRDLLITPDSNEFNKLSLLNSKLNSGDVNPQIISEIAKTLESLATHAELGGRKASDSFFYTAGRNERKENKKAYNLIEELISSNNSEISNAARKLFFTHLAESRLKSSLCDRRLSPEPSNLEAAFDSLVQFASANTQDNKAQHALNLAEACGYLYRKEGDDLTSNWIRRGNINPDSEKDTRLFNMFKTLQGSSSGRLLYKLVTDDRAGDIRGYHDEIYHRHLKAEISLSERVITSIGEQHVAASPGLQGRSLFTSRNLTNTVTVQNSEETAFIKRLGRDENFEFSIKKLELSCLGKRGPERKKALDDLVVAFELLSFRKAQAEKLRNDGWIDSFTSQVKVIETQQKDMLEALSQESGRDPELAQLIRDEFSKMGGRILLYHMGGTYTAAEEAVTKLADLRINEFKKAYGVEACKVDGQVITTHQGLKQLAKETDERLAKSSIELANHTLESLGQGGLINHDHVAAFNKWITAIRLDPCVTNQDVVLTPDSSRFEAIKKQAAGTVEVEFFGLAAAKADLQEQIFKSEDPAVVYVREKAQAIYGYDMNELINKIIDANTTGNTALGEKFILNRDSFLNKAATVMEEAYQNNLSEPRAFQWEVAVLQGSYEAKLQAVIDGGAQPEHEKLIQNIITADNKAHQAFFPDSNGQLARLLFAEEHDPQTVNGYNPQAAKRILGVFDLENRILGSKASDAVKIKAIEYIRLEILGNADFRLEDIANYQSTLNGSLGRQVQDWHYKAIVGSSHQANSLGQILKLSYMSDDIREDIAGIAVRVNDFIERETRILQEGLNGYLPAGGIKLTVSDHMQSLSGRCSELAQSFLHGKDESALGEFNEMMLNAFGIKPEEIFNGSTSLDETLQQRFMLGDHIMFTKGDDKMDIISVLIDIWTKILNQLTAHHRN